MAGEQVRGSVKLSGAGQLPGGFSTGGSSVVRPIIAPPTSPTTFSAAGVHLFGVPRGATTLTVEQWGGGGPGGASELEGVGGTGGGSGSYAKYTLTAPLIQPGGIVTVTVGAGGPNHSTGGSATYCVANRGEAKVSSGPGARGEDGGDKGTNTVTAGSGLSVATNTAGGAGSTTLTATGGAGGSAPGGGAGGGGGKSGEQGLTGSQPGAGGGGAGAGSLLGGAGGVGRVVITWG